MRISVQFLSLVRFQVSYDHSKLEGLSGSSGTRSSQAVSSLRTFCRGVNSTRCFLPGGFMTDRIVVHPSDAPPALRSAFHHTNDRVVGWRMFSNSHRDQVVSHADDGRRVYCRTYTARSRLLHVNSSNSCISFHGENPHERSTARQW